MKNTTIIIEEEVPFAIANIEEKVQSILEYVPPVPKGCYDEEDQIWKVEGKPYFWTGNTAGRVAGDKTWEGTPTEKGGETADDRGSD